MSVVREKRLMESFVALLSDHQKDFEGFVRDVENVRFCLTPIDAQQIARCEYAMRNMEILLLTINNCIHSGLFADGTLDELVQAKNDWTGMKARVDESLGAIHSIIDRTSEALRRVRKGLE